MNSKIKFMPLFGTLTSQEVEDIFNDKTGQIAKTAALLNDAIVKGKITEEQLCEYALQRAMKLLTGVMVSAPKKSLH